MSDEIDSWVASLLDRVRETAAAVLALFSAGASVGLRPVVELLVALVQAAEQLLAGPGRGADKHAAVVAALKALDKEYRIVERVERFVRLPGPFEVFDRRVIEFVLFNVATEVVVAVLNVLNAWEDAPRLAAGAGAASSASVEAPVSSSWAVDYVRSVRTSWRGRRKVYTPSKWEALLGAHAKALSTVSPGFGRDPEQLAADIESGVAEAASWDPSGVAV